jgi:hypothetical protein
LLKRGRLRLDRATATALVWAVWAAVSPGTLRSTAKGLLLLRNRRAMRRRLLQDAQEWRPRRPSAASAADTSPATGSPLQAK